MTEKVHGFNDVDADTQVLSDDDSTVLIHTPDTNFLRNMPYRPPGMAPVPRDDYPTTLGWLANEQARQAATLQEQ